MQKQTRSVVPAEIIQNKIYMIRGQKVMLDRDLAVLYGVLTRNLNKAVRRNFDRFPSDFGFTLTKAEFKYLMFQFGTSSWGGTRKFPMVFTEQGVAMLSSVLSSKRAIRVNIQIIRVFTKLREIMAFHKDLARKIEDLERKFQDKFQEHDQKIVLVFNAIKELLADKEAALRKKGPMGFAVYKSSEIHK
ncbi:MAG: ORF6N domain-containing protein [Candidatus Omnitrophica bacterium]|nr:ORF6N domain-containing protein [Candidatus Omnitrophota bacterium]